MWPVWASIDEPSFTSLLSLNFHINLHPVVGSWEAARNNKSKYKTDGWHVKSSVEYSRWVVSNIQCDWLTRKESSYNIQLFALKYSLFFSKNLSLLRYTSFSLQKLFWLWKILFLFSQETLLTENSLSIFARNSSYQNILSFLARTLLTLILFHCFQEKLFLLKYTASIIARSSSH